MTTGTLIGRIVAVGLLLLSGCDAARSMRDDLARLTSPQSPAAQKPAKSPGQPTGRARASQGAPAGASPAIFAIPEVPPPASPSDAPVATTLVGKSEAELRALLGAPSSEEDQPPGKRWRYRDGDCTLDVQLYPDVQTKQFGTLAYEVTSNDDTDEGKRHCLAQLQSRAASRN